MVSNPFNHLSRAGCVVGEFTDTANMNYKITMLIEDENENEVFNMNTTAGLNDFEENIIRKAEHAIKEYEGKMEYEMQVEIDRQAENLEYGV